jgi:hypothetical protein
MDAKGRAEIGSPHGKMEMYKMELHVFVVKRVETIPELETGSR